MAVSDMKAMIFAAGLGTRLKPLTDMMPKALVPVCGKPLILHVIEKLKSAGITEIVVNVHHFADMIEDYLRTNDNFGISISVSDERDMLLETGGGIRHAGPLLLGNRDAGTGHFLVHNVDILSDLDICGFARKVNPAALATLLVSGRNTSRYLLFDDDMRLVGWTNVSTGEVRSPYPDIDMESCRKLAFSGIHVLSETVFDVMDGSCFHEESRFPIIDFYLSVADKYPIYGVQDDSLHMIDVGKQDSLSAAEDFVRGITR